MKALDYTCECEINRFSFEGWNSGDIIYCKDITLSVLVSYFTPNNSSPTLCNNSFGLPANNFSKVF